MLIRPQVIDEQINPQKELSAKSNTCKNEIYMCKLDRGRNPFGSIMYDVVLVSEIVGDMPGTDDYNGYETVDSLSTVFGKQVHYFTGVLNDKEIDLADSKRVFNELTLYPTISYSIAFKDMDPEFSAAVFYRHKDRSLTKMFYRTLTKPEGALTDLESEWEEFKRKFSKTLIIDISDPRYPAMYKYVDESVPPRVSRIGPQLKGKELSMIPGISVKEIEIDFDAEEKANVERNMGIRALLGSNADDFFDENDPLVDRITLGNIARNIAVDFMKADVGGMEESCTLIFDNKAKHENGLNCGFKSLVSPFGGLYPVFDMSKSGFIVGEFNKICKVAIGTSTPRHYRVTLDSNPYEVTVRVTLMDEVSKRMLIGGSKNPYDFKGTITIKMKKSEAIYDFVTEQIHKTAELQEYFK